MPICSLGLSWPGGPVGVRGTLLLQHHLCSALTGKRWPSHCQVCKISHCMFALELFSVALDVSCCLSFIFGVLDADVHL